MVPEFENLDGLNNRRSFMKMLAAAPLFATIGARSVAATVSNTVASTFKLNYANNIYTRYGVNPIINGLGTYTYIGGSLPLPEARRAWEEASHYFADMFELQDAAGAHLAKLSGAEDGMITDGAAAAISSATAACIAGSDPNNILKLPDTTGMKNEVITLGGAGAFSDCITLCGAKLVIARTIEELPNAITPMTAMVYVDWQDYERIANVLKITKPAGVPILVDAADGFSPEKFTQYAKMGVDLYDFSGGKGICGPQASGVMLGRKDLITAAKYNSDPWEGAILRPLKFGKEEVVALLAAIDFWMHADIVAINKEWQGRVERIAKLVETVPGVTTSIVTPEEANSFPTLSVNWDEQKFGLTVAECATQLHTGTPRILVGGTTEGESVRGRLGPAAPGDSQTRRSAASQTSIRHLHDPAAGRGPDRWQSPAPGPGKGAQASRNCLNTMTVGEQIRFAYRPLPLKSGNRGKPANGKPSKTGLRFECGNSLAAIGRKGEQMRNLLGRRCSIFVLCFLLAASGAQAFGQVGGPIKYISVDGKAAGPMSNAGVLAGKTLYVAGQDGRNADGSLPKDFKQEVSQALANVQGVLHAAGMDFGNVVTMNVYLTHVSDVDGMNNVYWKTIGSNPPARTVLAIAALPNAVNIEINCIAVSSAAKRVVIHPQGWPQGPHIDPAGIQADDVLYMSAQTGTDPLTGKLPADFAGEAKQSMDNVVTVAKAANMGIENLIWVNPYMSTAGSNERQMNTTYASYFQIGNLPGRGTFTVVDLPGGNHMAFTCIAGADLSKRKIVRPRNERPSRTSSPGNLYDDTAYYSAKDAYVPGLGFFSADLGIQTRLSMRNLLDGLETADTDFSNVVSATIYMRDMADADQVQAIYGTFFKGNFPARTTLAQNLDLKAEDIEQISFIAVRQPQP